MNVLIVGYGEVGKAIHKIVKKSRMHNIFIKDVGFLEITERIDVMHVCIPYTSNFVGTVSDYISRYNPNLTILESTISPGTTKDIYAIKRSMIVHSPIRGRHPNIEDGIYRFVKFIGPVTNEAGIKAQDYYNKLGLKTEILNSPVETEVGKLLSTTYYAMNIAFHQEADMICKHFGADFKQAISRFNATCTMDKDHKIPRPVMYPGVIGGHCLIPNIHILKSGIESDFLDVILRSNERTKKMAKSKDSESSHS